MLFVLLLSGAWYVGGGVEIRLLGSAEREGTDCARDLSRRVGAGGVSKVEVGGYYGPSFPLCSS